MSYWLSLVTFFRALIGTSSAEASVDSMFNWKNCRRDRVSDRSQILAGGFDAHTAMSLRTLLNCGAGPRDGPRTPTLQNSDFGGETLRLQSMLVDCNVPRVLEAREF